MIYARDERKVTEKMNDKHDLPPYTIRESPKAKRVVLKMSLHNGFEVVVPKGFNQAFVQDVLRAKRSWILKAAEEMRARGFDPKAEFKQPQSLDLKAVPEMVPVEYRDTDAQRARLYTENGSIILENGRQPEVCRSLLLEYIRVRAFKEFAPRLDALSKSTGLRYAKLSCRLQKTRWGSCSGKGNISLNAKALFLRPELVRCLLLHELCHLKYPNHSDKFRQLMQKYEPDARSLDRELGKARYDLPAWVYGPG